MNNHLRWTSALIRSLYRSGVRHAVISPGSRSTPLTIAAAIHDGISKHVVIDERSAAFIALGIGKATGSPAILICTSGTAAANYYPAIVEAKESGVPMIVLTADRPPNLRGIGSSQTIDQVKLYGDQAVFFHEAGEPAFGEDDLRRIDYLGKQAVEAAVDAGGASHINLPFRKPLEPDEAAISAERKLNHEELPPRPASVLSRTISLSPGLSRLIQKAKRPLIIAGPADPAHALTNLLANFTEKLNAPVVAEPGSGVPEDPNRSIKRYEQFLRNADVLDELRPDLIIRFGDQPFTKSLLIALEKWTEVPVVHFPARRAVQDHAMSADYVIRCGVDDRINLEAEGGSSDWLKIWQNHDQLAEKALDTSLSHSDAFTDGHVFRTIAAKIPDQWNVMLSNSLIPRDMTLFGSPSPAQFVNRGAAGIDGITSTAVGIAERLGETCSLHHRRYCVSSRFQRPVVAQGAAFTAVCDPGGKQRRGTIFRMLPVHQAKELYTPYFETPQSVDLESLAKAHGIGYRKITTQKQLDEFSFSSLSGVVLVEYVTDADASMELRKSLWNYPHHPEP
jgi:2-succinyl-5-enolpyruvyl-6-hydroxy-3-cyclohexene-1-carboxylate synthase